MHLRNRFTARPLGAVAALGLVLAGAVTTVTAASIATAEDVVLLENAFEDGTYAPWGPRGGVTLAITDAEAHAGAASLAVTGRTAEWQGVATSSSGLFEPGGSYTVGAWVKLPAGTAGSTGLHFTAEQTPADGSGNTYTWIGGSVTATAGEWVQIGGTYAFPEGLSSATIYIEAAPVDGVHPSFLVDDVRITGTAPTPDVTTVTAVDFEDGTTGTWTPSGSAALAFVDDGAGGQALSVTRAADYEGIQSPTGIFEPGVTYDFSLRARLPEGAAGTPGFRFVVKPAYTWVGNGTLSSTEWTTFTGSWTAPADGDPATLQAYLGSDNLDAPYTILVDDIVVTTENGGSVPDVVPGGAVNPVTTPARLALGSGNVSALTFDDGPNPGTTPELLDFLAANNIKATFCVIGQNIQAEGGAILLRRIVNEGHVLCNHSTGYADMGSWTAEQVEADLIANMKIIRDTLGDPNAKIPFWRAPNGSWGVTPGVAVSLGMQPLAVVNTINDWSTQDVPTLTANLRTAMKPGEVVLAHDGGGDRDGTLAAVQTVVTERLAEGWTFTFPQGTPPQGGSVALSTDFESGLDGWGPRGGNATDPTVAITTADAASGLQSALVSGRDNQGDGIGRDVTGLLTEGVTYDLSAKVRFAEGAATDAVWLSIARTVDGATSYSTLGQFDTVTNGGWTEVRQSFTMGAAESAYLYFETDYNGTNTSDFLVDDIVIEVPEPPVIQDLTGIKETTTFPVGVAIDSRETVGSASDLLLRHFNQITPENHMKPEAWYDAERNFRIHPEAAALMSYAQANNLRVYGHVLTWHSQTPAWFFEDAAGNPLTTSETDKQVLRDRLRTHIDNVARALSAYGEFGGTNPLTAFDVVNEVVSDGGEYADGLRRSEWYRVLGEEFIDLSFQYAEETFNGTYAAAGADRPVTLFINDYNTEQGGKQDRYHALVERLLGRGVPLDGVGHQFHVSLAMPVSALDAAIVRFADMPVTQVVTELDVTIGSPVTQANLIEQGYYFRDAFRSFRAHAEDMYSVTVWGLTDGRSWRADNGDPLVFNDAFQAKPAYYGAVDGELTARPRTANVFKGDVALDAAATTSPEWSRLPLHAIEGKAKFQLRWAPEHVTAYVTVSDAAASAGDSVTFQLGSAEHTVNRDGTGTAPAVTSEREGGWTAVVHLPATATQGGTLALDVRVADEGVVTGWNTPGATGTLTLVEELSFLEVVEARTAPAIDGTVDGTWSDAGVVTTGKQVSGTDGAAADVRTLWRDNTLYVLAEVTDPVVDVSGSDPWIQDSVELYVDPGNAKNGSYRYDDTQIRISAENAVSFGTGDEAFQRNRVVSATTRTETGYVVEASISLLEYGGLDTFHGLDFQVNDAAAGARTSIRNWADPTGAGYQSTARWGVGRLVGPAVPAWDASTVYRAGEQVQYEGAIFEALWWTRNQVPGTPWGPWAEVGDEVVCTSGTHAEWTSTWIYEKGDTAVHDGHVWTAKWHSRTQEPGASSKGSPWKDLGTC
ncbi:endo-1,4-beta-xylanase [Antribacter gilvus]|uniref:endo-1,4-beta-xylanase n=1 Tax=Antribacter gilvus TaxID=2304675 RepID=UPI000F7AF185|nr:endo-1,4-beta-xylanase [Antribacter gilvus]